VGRASDRIFGNSDPRGEKPGNEVAALARGSDNYAPLLDLLQQIEIRQKTADRTLILERDQQVFFRAKGFEERMTESSGQTWRNFAPGRRPCRKVHLKELAVSPNKKNTALASLKADNILRPIEAIENDERAGQGGVPAKRDFGRGGEPPYVKSIAISHEKSSLGVVVLSGDILQPLVVRPVFQEANGGGVAQKKIRGKGIDLIDGYFHRDSPSENFCLRRLSAYTMSSLKTGHCVDAYSNTTDNAIQRKFQVEAIKKPDAGSMVMLR
jgi:hypothetical protein